MFPKTSVTATKTVVDLDEIHDQLSLASKAAEKLQFKVSQGYLKLLLTAFPGFKSALRIYNNTLTSIAEGLADGALTRAGAVLEVKEANVDLKTATDKALKDLAAPTRYDPDELYIDLSKDTLKVYDSNMNEIQTKLNKFGIFTGYVPVLPLTQPGLDVGKLKSAGIVAESFAGYTILKKEFVAGITHDSLKKLRPDSLDKSKTNLSEKDALEIFKEVIQAKYKNLHLVQLGQPIGWWGAMWIWFGSKKEYEVLKKCTQGNYHDSLKIQNWSFPFNRGLSEDLRETIKKRGV